MKRIVFLAMISLPLAAAAHHGWSEYDSSKLLKLSGRIVESGYEHPHGHVRVDSPGNTWNVILAPPSRMARRGLDKGMLKPGASIGVEGYANRVKPGEMRAERVIVNGKAIELR